jgi:hypothetical protein
MCIGLRNVWNNTYLVHIPTFNIGFFGGNEGQEDV